MSSSNRQAESGARLDDEQEVAQNEGVHFSLGANRGIMRPFH